MQAKTTIDELLERLRETEQELRQELIRLLEENREKFHYRLHRGKVIFEQGVRQLQLQQRTGLLRFLRQTPLTFVLSAPAIYGMIIPLLILDLSITTYQHICFRIYRIPRVDRSEYMLIDRHHLAYLNIIQKLNCMYCGYANGLMAYAREIAARTEQFWCPIKHAQLTLDPHHRVKKYVHYGDADTWTQNIHSIRRDWDEEVL
jgi:hypothetical protein